ncbi:MAG: MBL fold metallo-hydrolase [Spirochaetota bacterium]
MITFAVLGSGSNANAYYFSYRGSAVLIDNGFSLKELRRRSRELDVELDSVQAVFLSHTHSDHCRGVGVFARAYKVPVYLHPGVDAEFLQTRRPFEILPLVDRDATVVGEFQITMFRTSHDAHCSVNFFVKVGGRAFLIITDTGYVADNMKLLVAKSDILFLEANYEQQLLETGPYPAALRRRIASRHGHLSNDAAIELLGELEITKRLSHVYLCHLSAENNSPDLLVRRLSSELSSRLPVTVCRRGEMLKSAIGAIY